MPAIGLDPWNPRSAAAAWREAVYDPVDVRAIARLLAGHVREGRRVVLIAQLSSTATRSRLNQLPTAMHTVDGEEVVLQVKVALRVDTVLLTATEMTRADGTVEIARYSDGVFESVSDVGAARSIPPAHQFVRIEGQKIFSKKVRAVSTSCQKFLTRVATIPEFCFLSRTQQFARIGAHVGARHGHQG